MKYAFDNPGLDFLPIRWLLRVDSLESSVEMTRIGDVWLASTVGWIMGGPVAGMVGAIAGATTSGVASWAVLGGVYGALTGPVLVRLLRRPVHATAKGG